MYYLESTTGNRATVLLDVSVPASLAMTDIMDTTKVTLINLGEGSGYVGYVLGLGGERWEHEPVPCFNVFGSDQQGYLIQPLPGFFG